MHDRIPTIPGRVKLTKEGTSSPDYFIMEMADEPLNEGTPLNKNTFLTDATEEIIFGEADDKTVDEAFAELGGNRIRLATDADPKLYTAFLDLDNPFFDQKVSYKSYDDTTDYVEDVPFGCTKDYYFTLSFRSESGSNYADFKVYSRSNPDTLVRTVSVNGVTQSTLSIKQCSKNDNIIHCNHSAISGAAILVDLENGMASSALYNVGEIVYSDSSYIYLISDIDVEEYEWYLYKVNKSNMSKETLGTYDISVYGVPVFKSASNGIAYVITDAYATSTTDVKLISITLSSGNASASAISNCPKLYFNTIPDNPIYTDLLWYDFSDNSIYFVQETYTSGPPAVYGEHIYKINMSTHACSVYLSRENSNGAGLMKNVKYLYHLDNDIAVIIGDEQKSSSRTIILRVISVSIKQYSSYYYTYDSGYGYYQRYYWKYFEGTDTIYQKRVIPSTYKYVPTTILGRFFLRTYDGRTNLIAVSNRYISTYLTVDYCASLGCCNERDAFIVLFIPNVNAYDGSTIKRCSLLPLSVYEDNIYVNIKGLLPGIK